ncbi:MAG: flagellar basal body L-ring protein FlgH [Deltaproteobacteria bacterium]|nr:flagellar basal body L-ring protein FlgH [Deltaproteobacteria bacterium]
MNRASALSLATIALAALASACGPAHIAPHQPRQREYTLPPVEAREDKTSPGSLWHADQPAAMLYTDARALRENDLVVIKIEEIADARRSSDTDLTRNSKTDLQLAALFNRISPQSTNQTLQTGITGSVDQQFRGEGTSGRSERFIATVPSMVRRVLPNGNLFVEGHRVVLVNNEEQHFYISGVIRPIDIEQDNSIKSTMVADAEIEFTGRGDLSDNQKQGWFARHLGWIWPF